MNTASEGRTPKLHMMRACVAPIRAQSSREIAKAVGRPVVPEVPWTRAIASGGQQTLEPNGGCSSWSPRMASFVTNGKRARSSTLRSVSGPTPASAHRRR